MVYVLIMLMYVPSSYSAGLIATAEFASEQRCEAAAQVAKSKFDGWGSTLYYVCMPKS